MTRTTTPRSLRAVLYDWDGTLVDSTEATYRGYLRVFDHFGIAFGRDEFERTYSPDGYRTYTALGLPPECWDEANALWRAQYRAQGSELVPGAREAVAGLREAGFVQGIVTNGDRDRVRRELLAFGLDGSFTVVVCSGDAARPKPHPDPLLLALERLSLAPGEAAYLGDSPEDVLMARAAGTFSVGIPGGFPNRDGLRAARPDLMVVSLEAAAAVLLERR